MEERYRSKLLVDLLLEELLEVLVLPKFISTAAKA